MPGQKQASERGRPYKEKEAEKSQIILAKDILEPIWVSVSEAAKLGGIQQKTIRRAIDAGEIKFKIINNRYSIDIGSVIKFLNTRTKLKNKFSQSGLGQYVDKWK
ncbi:MAG: helix-turn-helix domain-containing protein [bacterium]